MAHSSGFQATASALDSLLSQSTEGMRAGAESSAECCCGRPQCAYLEHNDIALRGLEQDLQSAAHIGQALLVRHEAYMSEAEEQRRKMSATVDRLEEEKKVLEAKNASTIQENRYLLDQLEELNSTVSDADTQIVSLNATLQSTMKELDRLAALAAQTSHLEKQLANLELEQQLLLEQVGSKEESEKSAIQRWKSAERMVNALQEQVEQIEKEAREERARHAEVVARFERRRLVEKELESAAGRLKEAAAAKGMTKEDESNSVISSFVKDILQDNATLQMGIVELRDMLMGSNEEVENLREQMLLHQPIQPGARLSADAANAPRTGSLENELARTPNTEAMPNFHVHHHYHAAPKDETKRPSVVRRPRKKRNLTSTGLRTPNSGTQTPRTPRTPTSNPIRPTTMTSAATILAQTSVTIPPPSGNFHTHNWSMSQAPSSGVVSSMPNSPIFDTMSDVQDSSRPTTPGSAYLGSPQFSPRHFKRESDVSDCNLLPGQNPTYSISSVLHGDLQDDFDHTQPLDQDTIPEELEDDSPVLNPPPQDEAEECNPTRLIRPHLHRASSHESLLSSRGLDIPKIRSKPSTRLPSGSRPSLGTSYSSGVPIAIATAATAHWSKAPRGRFDSKRSYSSLLSASHMSTSPPNLVEKSTLGQRVGALGGWIAGRWGIKPAPGSAAAAGPASATQSAISRPSTAGKNGENGSSSSSPSGLPSGQTTTQNQNQNQNQNHTRAISNADPDGKTLQHNSAVTTRCAAENRLSTHIEPVHLDDSLLQESLTEESVPTVGKNVTATGVETAAEAVMGAAAGNAGRDGAAEAKRVRGREKRLSTHVEAVSVDGDGLAEALGGL